MANYSNFTGVKYDNFKSFLIALFAYLLVIFVLLYQISKPQEKFKKYTDNPNDYMDVTFDFEIDDKLPSAPEIAKETKQGDCGVFHQWLRSRTQSRPQQARP